MAEEQKNLGGRPPSPEVIAANKLRICKYLEAGLWFKDACIAAGVSEPTGHRYKTDDKVFKSQVEASISKYKEKLIKCINEGATKDPKIALDILKIRFPEEWNPVKKIQIVDPEAELKRIKDLIYGEQPDTTGSDTSTQGSDSQDPELDF